MTDDTVTNDTVTDDTVTDDTVTNDTVTDDTGSTNTTQMWIPLMLAGFCVLAILAYFGFRNMDTQGLDIKEEETSLMAEQNQLENQYINDKALKF